jgi:DNA-directed RNA polymerase subunit RPC12/RpoP
MSEEHTEDRVGYACPHCGSTKEPWFSRTMPMGYICPDCGRDVDDKTENKCNCDECQIWGEHATELTNPEEI